MACNMFACLNKHRMCHSDIHEDSKLDQAFGLAEIASDLTGWQLAWLLQFSNSTMQWISVIESRKLILASFIGIAEVWIQESRCNAGLPCRKFWI